MARNRVYIDLKGRVISLADLDAEEKQLVATLRRRARARPDWLAFRNDWTRTVGDFYDARAVPRRQAARRPVFRIALDLSSRLAVALGQARMPDYRDELEHLIATRFKNRRAFCKATGLSEDVLGQLLNGRLAVSLDTVTEALQRIGYTLHIAPFPRKKRTG